MRDARAYGMYRMPLVENCVSGGLVGLDSTGLEEMAYHSPQGCDQHYDSNIKSTGIRLPRFLFYI